MPSVTHDDRSFMVNGSRVWLVSGELHYFRVPAPLWRDRLLKARQAGLNCISTCVPWNFHEPQEGNWRFSGEQDVVAFVRLAGAMGLYVILRPGPYICAEWDFGGLPGWLQAKSGIAFRTSNAAYTHYFDKYFRQLLPRLAELQVSRGGNIILVQNENEYYFTTMPERLNYLEFINQLFRRWGFDIPIIACNQFSEPAAPGLIECVNAGVDGVQQLKKMRLRQPSAPLLMTELYTGSADSWALAHQPLSPTTVARRAMEALGCASQFNYYMWHGGTNFEYWGARQGRSAAAYQPTSYDFDAPLAEGGGLTEKYYLTRLVNLLACQMGRFLAGCTMDGPAVSLHDGPEVLNISGPLGRWAVVTNNGREEVKTARVSLPDGRELSAPLEPFGAAALPVGLILGPGHTLDYANLSPLGLFGEKVLVMHAPAGWPARLSVNGKEFTAQVPQGFEPVIIEQQGLRIAVVNSACAARTWFVQDSLVFGASFVGETLDEATFEPDLKQYAILPLDGPIAHRKPKPSGHAPAPPELGHWTRLSVCTEPVAEDLKWDKLDRPRDLDRLGIHYGYAWYRIVLDLSRPGLRNLFLPDCEDRATIFVNGQRAGTWGRGDGATRKPIRAHLKKGRNVLTILADNLGRNCDGRLEEQLKGLFGHIYDAKPLRPGKPVVKPWEGFARRMIPRQLSYLAEELEAGPVFAAEMKISLRKVLPIHLSFCDVPHHVAVLCNGRMAKFFPRFRFVEPNFGDLTLGPELKAGANLVSLLLWGAPSPQVLDRFGFHVLNEAVTEGAEWQCRALELPSPGGPVVGKDQPAWYVAKFKAPSAAETPLFLHLVGAKKGQLFLNGRNIGRFWNVGPQDCCYLPECWLSEENELLLFEEHGEIPRRSALQFRPQGPFRQ